MNSVGIGAWHSLYSILPQFSVHYKLKFFCSLQAEVHSKEHRRRKVLNIRGGQSSEYWEGVGDRVGEGGGNLFAGCKLIGAPGPNQCQIITFRTLKIDNLAKLRI